MIRDLNAFVPSTYPFGNQTLGNFTVNGEYSIETSPHGYHNLRITTNLTSQEAKPLDNDGDYSIGWAVQTAPNITESYLAKWYLGWDRNEAVKHDRDLKNLTSSSEWIRYYGEELKNSWKPVVNTLDDRTISITARRPFKSVRKGHELTLGEEL
jgi:hypothetical protein